MYNTAHSTVLFHNQGDYFNSRILQAERDTWHDWFAFPSPCYYKNLSAPGFDLITNELGSRH